MDKQSHKAVSIDGSARTKLEQLANSL